MQGETYFIPFQDLFDRAFSDNVSVFETVFLGENSYRNILNTGVIQEVQYEPLSASVVRIVSAQFLSSDGQLLAGADGPSYLVDISSGEISSTLQTYEINFSRYRDVYDVDQVLSAQADSPVPVLGTLFADFGAGRDTIVFSEDRGAVPVTPLGDGRVEISYADYDLVAENVEEIRFSNCSLQLSSDGSFRGCEIGAGLSPEDAQLIALIYEAGLDRDGDIDAGGLNFWIDSRENGVSFERIAEYFLDSPEFESSFGAPEDLSNRGLVERLYLNVLDRDGDKAGVDFWTNTVAGPDFSRGDLLVAFADSPENRLGSPFVEDLAEVSPGEWDFV